MLCGGARVHPLNWLDDDFACATDAVRAHLGVYRSVAAPAAAPALQRLSIGPVSSGDAMRFWALARQLAVPYTAEYV